VNSWPAWGSFKALASEQGAVEYLAAQTAFVFPLLCGKEFAQVI